jgi:hypothetical protein
LQDLARTGGRAWRRYGTRLALPLSDQPKETPSRKEAGAQTSHPAEALGELETVTLRLPVHLVRAVDQYAKYLGGGSDRTYVIAQAIEIALAQDTDFQKTSTARAGALPAAVLTSA